MPDLFLIEVVLAVFLAAARVAVVILIAREMVVRAILPQTPARVAYRAALGIFALAVFLPVSISQGP